MRKLQKFLIVFVLAPFLNFGAINISISEEFNRDKYQESNLSLGKNPDRGFYNQLGGLHKNVTWEDISKNAIDSFFRVYYSLTDFQDGEISPAKLDELSQLLQYSRNMEVTIIPRFYYTWGYEKGKKFSSPKQEIILRHVEQIAPILNEFKEAISFVEAGFIGAWGEWHSDQYGTQHSYKEFRQQLLFHMLELFDEEIYIALRYPSDHIKMDSIEALSERVGLHHDCPNYGSDIYPSTGAETITKFLPQGGEVCKEKAKGKHGKSSNLDKFYGCKIMLEYFDKFNFDALNRSDWSGSNTRFKKQGCWKEINKRLGYRYVIRGSKYDQGILTFEIENVGFGKSFKDRSVAIKAGDKIIETKLNARNWYSGGLFVEQVEIGEIEDDFVKLLIEGDIRLANESGNKIFLK